MAAAAAGKKGTKRKRADDEKSRLPKGYFAVDGLRACRETKEGKQYRVKWTGWDERFNSWEPEEHLIKGSTLLADLEAQDRLGWDWFYYVEKPIVGPGGVHKAAGWHP